MTVQSKSRAKVITTKDKISAEATTGLSIVGGTNITANAQASLPVYDENGTLLGHVALFDTATLT